MLTIFMTIQSLGNIAYAAEAQQDVDLNQADSILAWIHENIPEDLNSLTDMAQEWWDSLLPNQTRIAENLLMPVYRGEKYGIAQLAYTPEEGDQVANMSLASTGLQMDTEVLCGGLPMEAAMCFVLIMGLPAGEAIITETFRKWMEKRHI